MGHVDRKFSRIMNGEGSAQDLVDLRDQHYTPSLTRLPLEILPENSDGVFSKSNVYSDEIYPVFGVRNQDETDRCVGFALATTVDIQRRKQIGVETLRDERVSADMLYFMAAYHERYRGKSTKYLPKLGRNPSRSRGTSSLRSVIKGMYHHGVCLEFSESELQLYPRARTDDFINSGVEDTSSRWPSYGLFKDDKKLVGNSQIHLTVDQAKKAREITLGSYFRLKPILNDYHTAINEVGAICVAAKIHQGWVDLEHGCIAETDHDLHEFGNNSQAMSAHAFTIVGYDKYGFLVLNSWGEDWGGYKGYKGVALWRYRDWAENILDGWVLRLGVFTPEAFDVSIGKQGRDGSGERIRAGSPPCLEILGHYLHLEDGKHYGLGAYPSSPQMMETTYQHLANVLSKDDQPNEGYDGVLIWITGSLEPIKQTVDYAVQRKPLIKKKGLYPINLIWSSDFVEDAVDALTVIFERCSKQVGEDARHLEYVIENSVRGIGKSIWRNLKSSAKRAVHGQSPQAHIYRPDDSKETEFAAAGELLSKCISLCKSHNKSLHFVVEGAGALVFDEMLLRLAGENRQDEPGYDDFKNVLSSLQLVLPAINCDMARHRIIPLLDELNSAQSEPTGNGYAMGGRIYCQTARAEKFLRLYPYRKSILHLVANAFEEVPEDPQQEVVMLGMKKAQPLLSDARQPVSDRPDQQNENARGFVPIRIPDHQSGQMQQHQLTNHKANLTQIMGFIQPEQTG